MSTIAPGWYADPQTPGQLRYWDGSAWTEHVQPGAPAGAGPEPEPPTPEMVPGSDLEERLAALEHAVAALERRLDRAGGALAGDEPPGGG